VQITTDNLADEPASSKSALTLFSPLDRGHSPYALRMTTFALVHGSWHGAWCWELLSPFLRRPGHDVVAMDLRCDAGTDGGARVHRTNRLPYAVRCQHLQEVIDEGELQRTRTSTS